MRRSLSLGWILVCPAVLAIVLGGPWTQVVAAGSAPKDAPDPATQVYLSANGLLNRGLYELAAAEYRQFLSDHEDHKKAPVARYGLGVCFFRMNRHDATIEALTPLLDQSRFEFAAEVATILGQCHLAKRDYKAAAKVLKRVVRKHGDHALADDAASGRIEALYSLGQYEKAADESASFISQWSNSPLRDRATFFGGLSNMARKNWSDASEGFTELLDQFPKSPFAAQASLLLAQCQQHGDSQGDAIRQYRRVLKEANDRFVPDALLGLAGILHRSQKVDEAGALLDRLLEQYPESTLQNSARMQRGRVFFDQESFDRAFDMFEKVAEQDEDRSDFAAYWMAKCRLRQGNVEEAASRLADAARKFPKSRLQPEMLYDRAIALVRASNHDDAAKTLAEFRSKFPDHKFAPQVLHLLAATQHQLGEFGQCVKLAEEFASTYSSHELTPAVTFLAAESYFLAGRYEEASDGFESFLSRFSEDTRAGRARFRLGMALYRLDKFDRALEHLTHVTDGTGTEPAFRSALLALGDMYFQRSEWKRAEEYLEDYLASGGGESSELAAADDALLKLGLARQRQEQSDSALRAFGELIENFEESPHRLQAIFESGQALVTLERFDDAVKVFEMVVEQGGDSRFAPYALNHLAAIAMRSGDFDRTAALYKLVGSVAGDGDLDSNALFLQGQALMAAQRFADAESAFTNFLNDNSSHARAPEASAQRAIAMARQDKYAEAISAMDAVERRYAEKLEPSLKSALQYERAWCLRETGESQGAADAYRTLLSEGLAGDFNVHAALELAGIEINSKRFEPAAKLLRRLRKMTGEVSSGISTDVNEQVVYRLGVCEFELGNWKQSADLFGEFVDEFDKSALIASASYYGGESQFRLGRFGQAVEHFERIEKNHESDAVFGPTLLRLGECLATLQRWPRSERVFGKYLERFSDSEHWFQARFGVGWSRENQKRYDEAVSAYRELIARHRGPTAARAQFQIGECFFAQKKYDQAVRELLKVDILYAYPEWSAAALFEAGRCFMKLGQAVEARAHFKMVTEKHGQTRWAQMATERLSKLSAAVPPGR